MPSPTTVYRAIVMLAAAGIVVKGWQLYGPSAAQTKSAALRVVALAHAALQESVPPAGTIAAPVAGPHEAAPVDLAPQTGVSIPTPLSPAPAGLPIAPPTFSPPPPLTEVPTAAANENVPASTEADRLPALLARLEELGGIDPQLVAWGSSGKLYRFCCRAALAETPTYTRHFEAVAQEPLAAVENVLAKVEAWRTDQRAESQLR
jgi:hypothetical protein